MDFITHLARSSVLRGRSGAEAAVEATGVLEVTGVSKTWLHAAWHSKGTAMAPNMFTFAFIYDQFSGVVATASR